MSSFSEKGTWEEGYDLNELLGGRNGMLPGAQV